MGFFTRFSAAACSALDLHMHRYVWSWVVGLACVLAIAVSLYSIIAPPRPFPAGGIVVIAEGATAGEVANILAEKGVVAHPEFLRLIWRVTGTGESIPAGAYRFARPITLLRVAERLSAGQFGIPATRITFPEGTTVLDMAKRVSKTFPQIAASDFLSAAQPYEGYLFPDTYTFQPSATAISIVETLRETFAMKTDALATDVVASGRSFSDIIIMASIIEREARTEQDRHMISGVLWNRVDKGMLLQVDAVFGYIYSRATYSPSYADLTVNSPYNTYRHAGLPPGPISNPGLSSIDAALHPTLNKYLFYLTGRDGLMHYSVNYAGHKANLNAYLR